MDKNYIFDLIDRLRQSATPPVLREEVIRVITTQRHLLEEVHTSARHGSITAAETISGVALGKPGYGSAGDVGF